MTDGAGSTVAVIGSGIVGAACALELQKRGRQVTLIDRSSPGRGTSFGNMASIALDFAAGSGPSTWRKLPRWLMDPEGPVWLRPAYAPKILPWFLRFLAAGRPSQLRAIEDAGMALTRPALEDLGRMLAFANASDLMTEEGCLAIYEKDEEFTADRAHIELMRRYGFDFQVLKKDEIRDLEPALSAHVAGAVLLPDNKSIRDPYKLVVTLVEAGQAAGARFLSGEVVTVGKSTEGCTIILKDGERLQFDDVVVAAGVHSGAIARAVGEPIPLETERGYHTQIMKPGISMRYSIIWPARAFMVTPTAGGIRVGGNVELAGLRAAPDFRRARVLVRHAQRVLPGLKVEDTSEWLGHRPALPDTIPIISPSSRVPNLWYATGHGHLGLTLSATTARLVADMILQEKPSLSLAPYRIDRY